MLPNSFIPAIKWLQSTQKGLALCHNKLRYIFSLLFVTVFGFPVYSCHLGLPSSCHCEACGNLIIIIFLSLWVRIANPRYALWGHIRAIWVIRCGRISEPSGFHCWCYAPNETLAVGRSYFIFNTT
jgi:hypothetical protein